MGQRLTVELEATNTSKRPGHGIVMLNYPEHLVSFMALHTTGQATTVQLPASPTGPPAPAAANHRVSTLVESLAGLDPRERRTAIISSCRAYPKT